MFVLGSRCQRLTGATMVEHVYVRFWFSMSWLTAWVGEYSFLVRRDGVRTLPPSIPSSFSILPIREVRLTCVRAVSLCQSTLRDFISLGWMDMVGVYLTCSSRSLCRQHCLCWVRMVASGLHERNQSCHASGPPPHLSFYKCGWTATDKKLKQ